MDRAYVTWTGRKRSALRRPILDCGHRNRPDTEVFFHIWCDRLSCSPACAEAVHDCSAFAGVRSGIEDGRDVVDADVPDAFYDALDAALEEIGEGPGRHVAALAAQDEVLRQMAEDMPIPLTTLPAERTHIAVTTAFDPEDRIAEAFRSEVRRQGLAPCEIQIDGRTEWLPAEVRRVDHLPAPWVALPPDDGMATFAVDPAPFRYEYLSERVRNTPAGWPFPTAALDSEAAAFEANVTAALDELVEPERDGPQVFTMPATRGAILEFGGGYYRYACPHSGCTWEKVARFRPHLVDLVEAHDLEQHTRTSWWSRLLPGRRTRR
jgi:hypothetical protein